MLPIRRIPFSAPHGAGYTVRWDEVEQHICIWKAAGLRSETTPAQESVPRACPRAGAALDKGIAGHL